eukprot:1146767-Pelagomonas_calceolata.AAC.2
MDILPWNEDSNGSAYPCKKIAHAFLKTDSKLLTQLFFSVAISFQAIDVAFVDRADIKVTTRGHTCHTGEKAVIP